MLLLDIGEIKSMIQPEGRPAGILIPNVSDNDQFVTGIADAMEAMLDPERRKDLAINARALGETYSIDELAGEYLDLYREIIARRA